MSTCFTDDTSFNPPSQIMIPFLRKENQGEKKKRKPRCRERNEIVQGQPIQEAGASREPLSIPLAPGPPCLAPWHLGIVWLLSQLHRDAKSGGRCPGKGVCLVSPGGWAEFTAFNPHRCPVWPLPCCPGKHVEGDRGLVSAQPFFFFFFYFILWGCWHLLFMTETTSTLWYTNLTKCGGCCVWECDNSWNVQEKEGGKANTMSGIFYKTEGDPS